MYFLDTCIWIELLAVSHDPSNPQETDRVAKISQFYADLLKNKADIVTMKLQLIEVINAILKAKMKEFSKMQKQNKGKGVGQLKEYRQTSDYPTTLSLCRSVCADITKKARIVELEKTDIDIEKIIDDLSEIDINDSIYVSYCKKNQIFLYTIDQDFSDLANEYINIL